METPPISLPTFTTPVTQPQHVEKTPLIQLARPGTGDPSRYPEMTDDQQDRVVGAVREFLAKKKK